MTVAGNPFESPPVLRRDDGEMRRVGFELEFSGLTIGQTCDVLLQVFGGDIEQVSSAKCVLHAAGGLGEFNIELDWAYLKRKAAEAEVDEQGAEWVQFLTEVAALVVPMEVVCPPIALDRLAQLDPMVEQLRAAGALGTDASAIAAFGVHINPELPNLEADTLLRHLRAFTLLQWWLVEAHAVDVSRRITPYVDLYPEAYMHALLADGAQDMDRIFDDYLAHNATRNRALDLLPLLAVIDEPRVRAHIDDARISARPTFHYRLPNSHIDQPRWSLATPWKLWVTVERLADRRDDLAVLAQTFNRHSRPLLGVSRRNWVEYTDRWLNDHALA